MSNLSKNLLLALTLVCVIALVVFFIQLIVINAGVEPDVPPFIVSNVQDEDNEYDSGYPENAALDDNVSLDNNEPNDTDLAITTPPYDSPADPPDEPEPELEPPPPGTRHNLVVAENSTLAIYARDDLFFFSEGAFNWGFVYTGDGAASFEISLLIPAEQGLDMNLARFLYSYADGLPVELTDETNIRSSALSGYHSRTQPGEAVSYEAWIHDLEGSEFALVFVISYTSDSERDLLYAMIDSMFFA